MGYREGELLAQSHTLVKSTGSFVSAWMKLEGIMQSEISHTQNVSHLHVESNKARL